MTANALPAGFALQEYRIEKVLGVGGFGLTYLALDSQPQPEGSAQGVPAGRHRAARDADQSIAPRSPEAAETFGWGKQRFMDESRTVASFRHPNIVRVMRFFEANGTAYMVMEFVEGAALARLDQDAAAAQRSATSCRSPCRCSTAWKWCTSPASCTATSSPATSTSARTAPPVLLDFGSARQRASELTAVVSPGYAPFEQYHTHGKQGPWSDIYAFARRALLDGDRRACRRKRAARIRADNMPTAVQAGDRTLFRPEFLAAIDWALTPFEDERPQSVAEWREALLISGPPAPKAAAARPVEVKPFAAKPAEVKTEKVTETTKTQTSAPPRLAPDILRRAQQRLAEYIGPVATVVVKRAAAKARDEAELYLLLATRSRTRKRRRHSPARRCPSPASRSPKPLQKRLDLRARARLAFKRSFESRVRHVHPPDQAPARNPHPHPRRRRRALHAARLRGHLDAPAHLARGGQSRRGQLPLRLEGRADRGGVPPAPRSDECRAHRRIGCA